MSEQTPGSGPDQSTPAKPVSQGIPIPGETEQDRLRAMHEMLFDRNPDGVTYADSKGTIINNPAALQMLMIKSPPEGSNLENWQRDYGFFFADGKTPHPNETLPLGLALFKRDNVRDYELVVKSDEHPEGRVMSISASPMPNGQAIAVSRDITDRKRLESELAQRNAELAHQLHENNSLIERLRLAVDELSTPVLELADDILALPVVGIVDTVRSARMMEKILAEVVSRRCRAVIVDVTGVDVIDTSTADRFIRIARSIELLGADCVICGVQPAVSQTLTDLGVSFQGLSMQRNLKRALEFCIRRRQQSRSAAAT